MVRDWFDGRGTILTRTGEAPKRAIPFRTEQPFQKILVRFVKPEGSKDKPPGIEMLAHGQQFIVHGTHPETGRPYSWHAERNLLNTREPAGDQQAEAQSLVSLIVRWSSGLVFRSTPAPHGRQRTNAAAGCGLRQRWPLDVEASLAAMGRRGER